MLGRGRWTRRRSARHRLTLKPRHLAMVFCPLVLLVRLLLWYDFGLPWHDVTTFEGFATVHYLCAERPFLRPDTRTLGGRPPRGSDGSGSALATPPWDGVNLFGGGYVRGEEAQPEYVAQIASASVDGATGYVFDEQRVFHVNYCDDAEFLAPLEEPEWPEVSSHRRLATIAGEHTGHYYHWFAEDLPRLLLLEEFFASADGSAPLPTLQPHSGPGPSPPTSSKAELTVAGVMQRGAGAARRCRTTTWSCCSPPTPPASPSSATPSTTSASLSTASLRPSQARATRRRSCMCRACPASDGRRGRWRSACGRASHRTPQPSALTTPLLAE